MAIDFDFVLEKIGKFGRCQILIIIVIFYFGLPAGFNAYSPVFTFYAPDYSYRCSVPKLDNCPYEKFSDSVELITPSCDSDLGCNGCKRYNFTESQCSCNDTSCVNTSAQAVISCDNGYAFDTSLFSSTGVTEFNLVCDELALQAAATSLYMLGFLLGGLVFGYICDRIGRWPCILITAIGCFGSMLGAAMSTSYAMYTVFRVLVSFFAFGSTVARFVFVMEIVGQEYRTIVGMGFNMMYAVGYMVLPGLAYQWRDWRHLQLACLAVSSPYAVMVLFLPESPRWLFSNGKDKRPKKISTQIAKINGRTIAEKDWEEAKKLGEKLEEELKTKGVAQRNYSSIDLFKKRGIRMITFGVMFNCLVYYGISLNTGSLSGNIFVNNALGGVVELIGYVFCICTMDRFGRRRILVFMMLLAEISLLLNSILMQYSNNRKEMEIASQVCAFIGKMGISGSYGVIYNYTSELFPTVVRSNAMGVASTGARIGGIIAPFIIIVQEFVPWLPNVIFGVLSLVAAFFSLKFPETNGLLENLEEAELFYKGKSPQHLGKTENGDQFANEDGAKVPPAYDNVVFIAEENDKTTAL